LGVQPALGRLFAPSDAVPGAEPVAILSHEMWIRKYGGALDVIGARFEYGDDSALSTRRAWTIIGVLPAGFRFLRDYQVWLPLDVGARRGGATTVVARLKSDISPAAA